nr:hypothetical protein [Rhodohalobacter sp. 614A]
MEKTNRFGYVKWQALLILDKPADTPSAMVLSDPEMVLFWADTV